MLGRTRAGDPVLESERGWDASDGPLGKLNYGRISHGLACSDERTGG